MATPGIQPATPRKHWARRAPAPGGVASAAVELPPGAPARVGPAGVRASAEIAAILCGVILAGFMLFEPRCVHWFALPTYLCGCIVGIDAVDWARGRRRLFDPVGIIGVIGFHIFFLAPLLQVAWDYSIRYVVTPDDWRPWLGWIACLNVPSLCLYRLAVSVMAHRPVRRDQWVWVLRPSWFAPVIGAAMVLSVVLQALTYAMFGGIGGYVDAYSSAAREEFRGMGMLTMFSEPFPVLLLFAYVVYARLTGRGRSWPAIVAALVTFILLRVLFGGLRGSRAAYVWPMFWIAGLIHLWVRPIPRKLVMGGVVFLILFMYAYGLYKGFGGDVSDMMERGQITEMARERNRGIETTLISDLARSDIQAYILFKLWGANVRGAYEYAYGRTYLGAAVLLVPAKVWPDRPPTKVKEGTEIMFGRGAFNPRTLPASQAYGLAGEAMLNFGPAAVPVAYAAFGVLVGLVSRWIGQLSPRDSRMLMVPFAVSLCPFILIWDSDIIVVYIVAQGLLPFIITRVSSVILPRPAGDLRGGGD